MRPCLSCAAEGPTLGPEVGKIHGTNAGIQFTESVSYSGQGSEADEVNIYYLVDGFL